ncbi:hypothetical protein MPTA5024_18345 [Microbispora sp. ATCC PTA-5024]|nr:hypothetical protein [Microbispora sp. ATCC PTA-5024]ETK34635.1 hypothetical protein MPTA5024_18345 [Microbispora sp. ATCC PTA-5024]
MLGLTQDRTITVSARFVGRAATAREMVLALNGRSVREPQRGLDAVHSRHIEWHGRQVFRAPARG